MIELTEEQIDKAVALFRDGNAPRKIATALGLPVGGTDTIRKTLIRNGHLVVNRPPKGKAKLTIELPMWCIARLQSAAQCRQIKKPENVATLILVSRLARGSISDDLRGLGAGTLYDEELVQDMLS
jgi:hypothetical protein